MKFRFVLCSLSLLAFAFADTLTLKDGSKVQGTFLGGDSRQIRMLVGEASRSFAITELSTLQFGNDAPASPVPAAASRSTSQSTPEAVRPAIAVGEPSPERVLKPAPQVAGSTSSAAEPALRIPSGTNVTVRMIDDVDSDRDEVGQTFRASLDDPITLDGVSVVERGADVTVKLIHDKESGKLSGRTELTLDLVSVRINGKDVPIDTQAITQASESRTGRTGKVVGGTAALGAIIGAIAGGGKGAAIGAVAGAGAGAGAQILTKGQRVKIPSETRLTFTLQQPVRP